MKNYEISVYSILGYLILGAVFGFISLITKDANGFILIPTISFFIMLYYILKLIRALKKNKVYKFKSSFSKYFFYIFFFLQSIVTGIGGVYAFLVLKDFNLGYSLIFSIIIFYFAHCLMNTVLIHINLSKKSVEN